MVLISTNIFKNNRVIFIVEKCLILIQISNLKQNAILRTNSENDFSKRATDPILS